MELVVEILTGRFFHVEVEDDATVGSLKKAIASKEMFQEQRLVLMLSNGRLLRDDQCALAECGVVDGSIIYLFFTSVGNPNWLTFFEDFVTFFSTTRIRTLPPRKRANGNGSIHGGYQDTSREKQTEEEAAAHRRYRCWRGERGGGASSWGLVGDRVRLEYGVGSGLAGLGINLAVFNTGRIHLGSHASSGSKLKKGKSVILYRLGPSLAVHLDTKPIHGQLYLYLSSFPPIHRPQCPHHPSSII
ncbi:unnamed protein product [Musa acuminata var. zebrina]